MKNSSAKAAAPAPSKIRVNAQQKLLLVDAENIIFATIGDGLISIIARDLEATTNHRTLDELEEALASESFFRAHRSFLVNIHHINEVVPCFKSPFVLKMNDKNNTQDQLTSTQP